MAQSLNPAIDDETRAFFGWYSLEEISPETWYLTTDNVTFFTTAKQAGDYYYNTWGSLDDFELVRYTREELDVASKLEHPITDTARTEDSNPE